VGDPLASAVEPEGHAGDTALGAGVVLVVIDPSAGPDRHRVGPSRQPGRRGRMVRSPPTIEALGRRSVAVGVGRPGGTARSVRGGEHDGLVSIDGQSLLLDPVDQALGPLHGSEQR
jgi:hypothetical protein